jgi:NAD-dependent dihydropyrimidine dehydrogenase PreA subunit
MIRNIIKIDESKCDGCGLCAEACHEGAIQIVDGKARLMRDDYCDGLGNCLPVCPTGAITFEEREAKAFDEKAVEKHLRRRDEAEGDLAGAGGAEARDHAAAASELRQWPVQIRLAPVNAPYFSGAKLLIAADCAAYARASFHEEFMRGKVTLIGCPKLDGVDYAEKLTEILRGNDIRSVTVVRMEVPCCGGIEQAVGAAVMDADKPIPWSVVTLSVQGDLLEDR